MTTFVPLLLVVAPAVGALLAQLGRPAGVSIATTSATLVLAGFLLSRGTPQEVDGVLGADSLSALLVALTALVSWMAVLSVPRALVSRTATSALLVGEAMVLLALLAQDVRVVSAAWVASLAPLYVGLRAAGEKRAARVYAAYALSASLALTVGVLWLGPGVGDAGWHLDGWARRPSASPIPFALLVLAVLVRKAVFPFHSWLPPVFASRCLGPALLLMAPMLGAYAMVRLAVPLYGTALGQPLALIGPAALFTTLYAAAMALVQSDLHRVVAWLAMSQSAVVLLGLESRGEAGVIGAVVLWLSAGAALTAFGLVSWDLEARYGPLKLDKPKGLYRRGPFLAWSFLATGLGLVAMPGTIGFASNDLLLRSVLDTHPYAGLLLFAALAANGFTVFRAFTRIFFGPPAPGPVIDARLHERLALIAPLLLIVGFGLAPRIVVSAGARAAACITSP
jgi:NADH-quinone oxidoreductase subunit M